MRIDRRLPSSSSTSPSIRRPHIIMWVLTRAKKKPDELKLHLWQVTLYPSLSDSATRQPGAQLVAVAGGVTNACSLHSLLYSFWIILHCGHCNTRGQRRNVILRCLNVPDVSYNIAYCRNLSNVLGKRWSFLFSAPLTSSRCAHSRLSRPHIHMHTTTCPSLRHLFL